MIRAKRSIQRAPHNTETRGSDFIRLLSRIAKVHRRNPKQINSPAGRKIGQVGDSSGPLAQATTRVGAQSKRRSALMLPKLGSPDTPIGNRPGFCMSR
jgi:hypothetical protein